MHVCVEKCPLTVRHTAKAAAAAERAGVPISALLKNRDGSVSADAQRLKQNSTLASTLRLVTRVLGGDVKPSTRCTRRGGATTQRGAGQ